MSASPSVIAAATTLAEWARERRRVWSDVPLDVPPPVIREAKPPVFEPIDLTPVVLEAPAAAAVQEIPEPVEIFEDIAPEAIVPEVLAPAPVLWENDVVEPAVVAVTVVDAPPVIAGPSALERMWDMAQVVGRGLGRVLIAGVEGLEAVREPALHWMIRGAALLSTASVVGLIVINRGELFTRWDHVSSTVVAAVNRPPAPPPAVMTLPNGVGRLTVAVANGEATVLVDGTPQGTTPLTLNLPAGPHRVLLRSPEGSVERTIRVQSGESAELSEAIYPGWVALSSSVDVTLSEDGKPLKRDDRGWAILPPGPHEIHLDNRALGVHEVRRVVVMPGDTTRLSFAAHTSTISLTTNEVADVWIDGQSYGQAPLVDQPIAIGVHDVRVRSASHERWLRVRATVQPLQVNVDLTAAR